MTRYTRGLKRVTDGSSIYWLDNALKLEHLKVELLVSLA